jgi:hypothetical protein
VLMVQIPESICLEVLVRDQTKCVPTTQLRGDKWQRCCQLALWRFVSFPRSIQAKQESVHAILMLTTHRLRTPHQGNQPMRQLRKWLPQNPSEFVLAQVMHAGDLPQELYERCYLLCNPVAFLDNC